MNITDIVEVQKNINYDQINTNINRPNYFVGMNILCLRFEDCVEPVLQQLPYVAIQELYDIWEASQRMLDDVLHQQGSYKHNMYLLYNIFGNKHANIIQQFWKNILKKRQRIRNKINLEIDEIAYTPPNIYKFVKNGGYKFREIQTNFYKKYIIKLG